MAWEGTYWGSPPVEKMEGVQVLTMPILQYLPTAKQFCMNTRGQSLCVAQRDCPLVPPKADCSALIDAGIRLRNLSRRFYLHVCKVSLCGIIP
jgi:hypothetical protein